MTVNLTREQAIFLQKVIGRIDDEGKTFAESALCDDISESLETAIDLYDVNFNW